MSLLPADDQAILEALRLRGPLSVHRLVEAGLLPTTHPAEAMARLHKRGLVTVIESDPRRYQLP
jgi:hypothetical protein